jgi:hypothetical protein
LAKEGFRGFFGDTVRLADYVIDALNIDQFMMLREYDAMRPGSP